MKYSIYILIFLLSLSLSSCHKQSLNKSSSIVKDSLVINYKTEYIKKDSLVITNKFNYTNLLSAPCDSNGILKHFKQSFNSGPVKVSFKSVGDDIELKIDIDSITSHYQSLLNNKDSIILKKSLVNNSSVKVVVEKDNSLIYKLIFVIIILILIIIYLTKKLFM